MSRVNDQRKAALDTIMRQTIHEAILSVVIEHGLNTLTVDKVAKAAGVAKGTVYNYYKNKVDLLNSFYDRLISPIRDIMAQIRHSNLRPDQKLEMILRELLQFCEANKILLLQFEDSIFEKAKWEERTEHFGKITSEIIEQGISQGIFRKTDPLRTSQLFLSFIHGFIELSAVSDEQRDLERDVRDVLDLLLYGLATNRRTTTNG